MTTNNVSLEHSIVKEPVLPLREIQGIVVPGFTKPHETLVGVQFGTGSQVAANIKEFLGSLKIANAEETLRDRREQREHRRAARSRYPKGAP